MSRGNDDDEDTSAAPLGPPQNARPVAPATGGAFRLGSAATQPAGVDLTGIRFGVVGVLHRIGELREPVASRGQIGVIRLVGSGVGYVPPPLPRVWAHVPAEYGRFDLLWQGTPLNTRTLSNLRADLVAAGDALLSGSHPLLDEANRAAVGLIELTRTLHAAGWRLGLLQPDNLALIAKPGGLELVPLDLGFSWRGDYGPPPWTDSPGRPEWLNDSHASALWSRPAVEQQFAQPGAADFAPSPPEHDVQLLVRLLAWLGTGQFFRSLQGTGAGTRSPALWQSLQGVRTLDDLERVLARNPVSLFFGKAPPPPVVEGPAAPPRKKGGAGVLVAGFLAVGVLAAGYVLFGRDLVKPKAEVALRPEAKAAEPEPKAKAEPKATPVSDALAPAWQKLRDRYTAAPDAAARKAIDGDREKFVDTWVSEYTKLVGRAGEDVVGRYQIAADMQALIKQIEELRKLPAETPALRDKETQCLEQARQLAENLGS